MRVYLETSSLIKIYQKEEESECVFGLFEAYVEGKVELFTSEITILELVRGLVKSGLDEAMISRIEADFRTYVTMGLTLVPVSGIVLQDAITLIKRNRLSAIDAIHAASAVSSAQCLISNDEHLLKESLKKELEGKISILKPSEIKI